MNLRLFFKRLKGSFMSVGTPLSVLLIALTLPQSNNAQALYGSITGAVKDNSGALVPGATVRITRKETNQTRETASSQDGSFNFPAVQTGTYEITVSQPGFMTYRRSGVEVRLNNNTRSDIMLEVGGVSETVSVTSTNHTSDSIHAPELFNSGLLNATRQGGDSAFQFFSQEMSFDRNLVKGAPFSADFVSETIQNLPDGNRIVQRSEGRIYRDSQGRTRSERTYLMGGSSEQKQVINISDTVAGESYSLDPQTRIARKNAAYFAIPPTDYIFTPPFNPNAPSHAPRRSQLQPQPLTPGAPDTMDAPKRLRVSGGVLQGGAIRRVQPQYPALGREARASGAVQVQVTISETGEVIEANSISGHPLLRDAALVAARQWLFKPTELSGVPIKVQGVLTFNFALGGEESAQVPGSRIVSKYPTNTEKLAKRTVEGVECEGVRSVTTIPAGAIGNERPMETVSENWYSPELKMTILSKRSDPRFGESTYQVINIVRAEPDPALFQIPSDYTIIDSRARKIQVDVKEYEEMRRKIEIEKKKTEGARKPDNH